MSCILLFTKTFCDIKYQHLRTLIRVCEQRDGLYYFREFPMIGALNIDRVSFSDLRLHLLGYPSYKVMRSLPFWLNLVAF